MLETFLMIVCFYLGHQAGIKALDARQMKDVIVQLRRMFYKPNPTNNIVSPEMPIVKVTPKSVMEEREKIQNETWYGQM